MPAIYQNLSPETIREVSARHFKTAPVIATVLPE
jgi:hypothetical protein